MGNLFSVKLIIGGNFVFQNGLSNNWNYDVLSMSCVYDWVGL